jgi:hypothetical protein
MQLKSLDIIAQLQFYQVHFHFLVATFVVLSVIDQWIGFQAQCVVESSAGGHGEHVLHISFQLCCKYYYLDVLAACLILKCET